MKTLLIPALLLLSGCASQIPAPSVRPISPPSVAEAGKVVTGHRERERVQFNAAERINVVVSGLAVEPDVREQTGIIVEANKAASAQQIDDILAAFARSTAAFDARHAEDQKTIGQLKAEVKQLLDAAAQKTVSTLRKIGLGALGLALVIGYVGFSAFPPLRAWAFVLSGLGVLCLSFAQLWAYVSAQWWFMPLTGAVAVGIIVAIAAAAWRSFKDGTLAKDSAAAAAQTADTLKVIVAAVEEAKQTFGKTGPISALQDILARKMNDPHKAMVEDLVRETKPV